MGAGYYRVHVRDACGRINVNTLCERAANPQSPESQSNYAVLLHLTGDPAVAAAIIDWWDPDNVPRAGGTEHEYYTALPQPYLPRNGPFQTLGELLLVRGVTPAMFFGGSGMPGLAHLLTVESLSPDTDAQGRKRENLNLLLNRLGVGSQPGQDVVPEWLQPVLTDDMLMELLTWRSSLLGQAYTSLSQVADALELYGHDFLPLLDCVSVSPRAYFWRETEPKVNGKVNVNTAPPEVLAALAGGSIEMADVFASAREAEPFASLSEVATLLLEQPNGRELFAHTIDHLTTKSSSFIVQATGRSESGRAFRTVSALVRRFPSKVIIVQQGERDWPLPQRPQEVTVAARE
jgi:DNA uptake protein ComE-like DNA-binding protein